MGKLDAEYMAELVKSAKKNNSDALAELYAATYERTYAFALRYLESEDQAQKALKETYIQVFKSIHSLRDPKLFISWLSQITFRVCFNMQKPDAVSLRKAMDAAPSGTVVPGPEDLVITIDRKEYIARRVLALPISEAQAVLLHYQKNLPLREIAAMMDISVSSVKRYMASGKKKLAGMKES